MKNSVDVMSTQYRRR